MVLDVLMIQHLKRKLEERGIEADEDLKILDKYKNTKNLEGWKIYRKLVKILNK